MYGNPTIGDGVLYASGRPKRTRYKAIDLEGRAPLWRDAYPVDGSCSVLTDDGLYISGGQGHYCLNPTDGTVRWSYRTDETAANSIAVFDGSVYATLDNTMYALE